MYLIAITLSLYFLAAKDSNIVIDRFRFFTLSVLIVTGLGVANEMLEFFLQSQTGLIFTTSINDTRVDLTSTSSLFMSRGREFLYFKYIPISDQKIALYRIVLTIRYSAI